MIAVCILNSHTALAFEYWAYHDRELYLDLNCLLSIILEISSVVKLTVSNDLLVSFAGLLRKTLLLFNRVHWFAKKVLKSSAFSLKFVINLFSWNRGVIPGIFLLFRKVFKMDQYVFELVAELANLRDNSE